MGSYLNDRNLSVSLCVFVPQAGKSIEFSVEVVMIECVVPQTKEFERQYLIQDYMPNIAYESYLNFGLQYQCSGISSTADPYLCRQAGWL
jgi:hypothetical protein